MTKAMAWDCLRFWPLREVASVSKTISKPSEIAMPTTALWGAPLGCVELCTAYRWLRRKESGAARVTGVSMCGRWLTNRA